MPVYNGEKFIEKSLSSILKQKIEPYEIIVIDDASTDNSYKILNKYQKKFKNIKLFRNNTNLGEHQTTMKLIEKATGDFIKILHQDDGLYENYALEISQINDIYKYSFIVNDYTYITEKNIISNYLKKIWNNFKLDPNKLNKEDLLKFLLIYGNYLASPSNVLFNRGKLLKVYYSEYVEKLISQNLFYGYDYYLSLKLLEDGEVYVLFKDLSFRVEHSENQTANTISSLKRVAGYYNILRIFENHLNEREKKLAYSNLFGRAMYSINSCKSKEEKNKMVQFVLNNYEYLTIDEKSKLNQMLENI